MSQGQIHYDVRDGVASIVIDRPAKRNAISSTLGLELGNAFAQFQQDSEARVAVLSATGTMFTAGADLADPPLELWHSIPGLGCHLDKPVIAAVEGKVIGMGLAMVAFCDLCVAASDTNFIYPEARLGMAAGLAAAIASRMPHKIAMEVLLMGKPLTAQRAYAVGFINEVVTPGTALHTAQEMAAHLALGAPLVQAMLKDLVAQTLPRSPVERMYDVQRTVIGIARSNDAREGVAAFREGRAPRFTGT